MNNLNGGDMEVCNIKDNGPNATNDFSNYTGLPMEDVVFVKGTEVRVNKKVSLHFIYIHELLNN